MLIYNVFGRHIGVLRVGTIVGIPCRSDWAKIFVTLRYHHSRWSVWIWHLRLVTATLVESVLSRQLDGLEPTLTQHGYRLKDMVEQFDAKPAEIRALFNNQWDPARTADLRDRMLVPGLPIWRFIFAVIVSPEKRIASRSDFDCKPLQLVSVVGLRYDLLSAPLPARRGFFPQLIHVPFQWVRPWYGKRNDPLMWKCLCYL